MKKVERKIVCMIFLLFIFVNWILVLWYAMGEQKDISNYIENGMNQRSMYVEIYGLTQKVLGKKQIENFTIFKDKMGKLQRVNKTISDEEIDEQIALIIPISKYCKSKEIPFVYLTGILPVQNVEDLPYDDIDYSRENAEKLCEKLLQSNIDVFDLRENEAIKHIPANKLFYYTDHHWTMRTSFTTYQELMKELRDTYGIEINTFYTDRDNYETVNYEDAFLGSFGVKVGRYYAGKDDFEIYRPKFDTFFSFEALNENGQIILSKQGEWLSCLMDMSMVENKDYDNKYNAFSNMGYIENRIINFKAENDMKVLYISHSYGRPVTQYLATCFREVRNLDPQEGRFCGNYLDYIDEYQPDVVILQGECEGELVGNYLTER